MRDFAELLGPAQEAWQRFNDPSRARVLVAMGTCSIAAGAERTLKVLQAEVASRGLDGVVQETSCYGLCFEEPTVDVCLPGRPRITYRRITYDRVPEFVEDVLIGRELRPDLAAGAWQEGGFEGVPDLFQSDFMRPQTRQLMVRMGRTEPASIDHYLATGGYGALHKAVSSLTPEQIIGEVKKSNLQGRGGAYFPTGRKWDGARAARGYPKYIICNTDEGIPGVWVDRTVIEGDPHAVLEGMIIAAFAVGSDSGFQYIRAEYPLGASRFEEACEQARARGLLGRNILGTKFSFDVEVRRGAGSYVAGESSALMSSIEGLRAMPRLKRPRSVEKGLWGKPTCMNNTETFANIAWIVNYGGEWYNGLGSSNLPGTKLFSVSGNVARTGVVEVLTGAPTRTVVEACGGVPPPYRLKAIHTDGPGGGLLPASLVDTPLDYASYEKEGVPIGAGGLQIVDERTCIVELLRYDLNFNAEESCGRCSTCRGGTQAFVKMLELTQEGYGNIGDLAHANRLGQVLRTNSHCGLGQAAPLPVFSGVKHFAEEWEAHYRHKRCPAKVCPELIQYTIDPSRCGDCRACARSCPTEAIVQRDGSWTILDDRCIRCNVCAEFCSEGAIKVIDRPWVEGRGPMTIISPVGIEVAHTHAHR